MKKPVLDQYEVCLLNFHPNILYYHPKMTSENIVHSVIKNCSDLSLFEWIVLVISKILKIPRPSASNFKKFSRSLEQFFLIICQNNFGNKIPIWHSTVDYPSKQWQQNFLHKKLFTLKMPLSQLWGKSQAY